MYIYINIVYNNLTNLSKVIVKFITCFYLKWKSNFFDASFRNFGTTYLYVFNINVETIHISLKSTIFAKLLQSDKEIIGKIVISKAIPI